MSCKGPSTHPERCQFGTLPKKGIDIFKTYQLCSGTPLLLFQKRKLCPSLELRRLWNSKVWVRNNIGMGWGAVDAMLCHQIKNCCQFGTLPKKKAFLSSNPNLCSGTPLLLFQKRKLRELRWLWNSKIWGRSCHVLPPNKKLGLKFVHFKNTVTGSSFHSKLWPFSITHQLTSKQSHLKYHWKWSLFWVKWALRDCLSKIWFNYTSRSPQCNEKID
jgi:hypothetical protein